MSHAAPQDRTSWHDNLIYGLHLRCADPDRGVWRSELVLDIDHILEWLPQPGSRMRFLMVPTTLVFHDVSDLAIALDFGAATGNGLNLNELSIDDITREPVPGAAPTDYHWRIGLNHPPGGEIHFRASQFTQIRTAPPLACEEQRYPSEHRPPFSLAALP